MYFTPAESLFVEGAMGEDPFFCQGNTASMNELIAGIF